MVREKDRETETGRQIDRQTDRQTGWVKKIPGTATLLFVLLSSPTFFLVFKDFSRDFTISVVVLCM